MSYQPTPCEQRVIRELARDGAANPEIARRLGVSMETVKFHLHNLLEATGCVSRTALALWWVRVGQYSGMEREKAS